MEAIFFPQTQTFCPKRVLTHPPHSSLPSIIFSSTRRKRINAVYSQCKVIVSSQWSIGGPPRILHSRFSAVRPCCHGHPLATATATTEEEKYYEVEVEDAEDESDCDVRGDKDNQQVKGKGSRWADVDDNGLDKAQKRLIEALPPKLSGRSKALIKHIISLSEEDDPSELIMKWVRIMKPKRVDWLAVLKQMEEQNLNHPLFFKITEIALSEESFEANIRDYTKLIDAYARKGNLEDAERILRIMEERGFICDEITFTVLIQMYSKAGNLDRARHIFDKMKLSVLKLDQKAYGSMVMAYVRAGLPEAGVSLVREMESNNITAGKEVYKALLKSFAHQGNADGAQRVFNCMQFAGIVPNLNSCTILLEAYARAGDPDQARAVFENIIKAGLNPDDKCISVMIYAYEIKNLLGKALILLLNLEKDGFKPGAETSSVLIDWLGKLGLVEEAELLFDEMAETEVPSKVLVSLWEMYARVGMQEKAAYMLGLLQKNSQALNVNGFERLISGLLAGGFIDEAKNMHDQMQIQGMTPSKPIAVVLTPCSRHLTWQPCDNGT